MYDGYIDGKFFELCEYWAKHGKTVLNFFICVYLENSMENKLIW